VTTHEFLLPGTYKEATIGKQAAYWRESMEKESTSLVKDGTWILTDLPGFSKATVSSSFLMHGP